MKTYRLVKTETIQKMLKAFSDDNEYQEFGLDLNQFGQEMQYLGLKMVREPNKIGVALAKQIFTFAMFCRDNIDLIHDLVNAVDYDTVTEDQVQHLTEEGELEKDWD